MIDLYANLILLFGLAHKAPIARYCIRFSLLEPSLLFLRLSVTEFALRPIIPYPARMASHTCIEIVKPL